MNEYLAKVIKEWKSLETQGWCGYSKMYSGEKYFRERVDSLIDTYSDEVLIDQKLDAVYGCVQGGHAVAQWLLEHPNQEWNNSYLIYLYADLDKWKVRLDLVNKDYSTFREPDLNNRLTAIALQDDGCMFKKLKLVRE